MIRQVESVADAYVEPFQLKRSRKILVTRRLSRDLVGLEVEMHKIKSQYYKQLSEVADMDKEESKKKYNREIEKVDASREEHAKKMLDVQDEVGSELDVFDELVAASSEVEQSEGDGDIEEDEDEGLGGFATIDDVVE